MTAKPHRAPAPVAAAIGEQRPRSTPLRWFAPMPIALLKDPSVAAESKVLAGLLIAYDGPKGCFPKIASLMKDLGASKHTVIRSLEELERYGFLTREKRGRNNTYHLTPAYVQPARPDDIVLTGNLAIENAAPAKPVRRTTLHKRRPDPTLPLTSEKVAPVQPIPISRGKRGPKQVAPVQPIPATADRAMGSTGATYSADSADRLVAPEQPGLVAPVLPDAPNRLHRSNLDITKNQFITNNQQQQEAAANEKTTKADAELILINAYVVPEDAVRWAADLVGLDPADIRDALSMMRSKPAYQRREIARPGAYLRTLCKTAVVTERELAEHTARKARPAAPEVIAARAPATDVRRPERAPAVEASIPGAATTIEAEPPDASALLDALDSGTRARVHDRALRLCKSGPTSPAWIAAVSIALSEVRRDVS